MKNEFTDGSHYRLAKLTKLLNSKIKTIAILSAENPCGVVLAPEINKERNSKLEKSISPALYAYTKLKGNNAGFVNSFMVNNMTKYHALKFGFQYQQATIIYGKRFEDAKQYGLTFQMIKSFNCDDSIKIGEIIGERTVFINKENPEDFYSECKGCKFQIPVFDEEIGLDGTYNYVNATWKGGKIVGSKYIPDKLSPPDNERIDALLEVSLIEDKIPKWGWIRRGQISNILNHYSK